MGIRVMQYENPVIGVVLCWVRILFVLGVVIGLSRLLSLVWRQKNRFKCVAFRSAFAK